LNITVPANVHDFILAGILDPNASSSLNTASANLNVNTNLFSLSVITENGIHAGEFAPKPPLI
jgi:hypothetical protein